MYIFSPNDVFYECMCCSIPEYDNLDWEEEEWKKLKKRFRRQKYNNTFKKLHFNYNYACFKAYLLMQYKVLRLHFEPNSHINGTFYREPISDLDFDIRDSLHNLKTAYELLGIKEELISVVCHPRNYHKFEDLGFFD